MARLSTLSVTALGLALGVAAPAWAQKNSGPLLPVNPPAYSAPAYSPPFCTYGIRTIYLRR